MWGIVLPSLASTSGWLLTETGRQPWVVHGLLKTEEAGSPTVTGAMVLTSLIGFALIYALLMLVDVYLLAKTAGAGPETTRIEPPEAAPSPLGLRAP